MASEGMRLLDFVVGIHNPRVIGMIGRTDHDLVDILVLALCAVMAGAEGWDNIEDWGLNPNATQILRAARLHWGIENGFHRCLDVAFREDASAIRLRNAAANFALLRRFALNLFRLDKISKKSLPRKRKAAAWNPRHLVELLNLQPLQEI